MQKQSAKVAALIVEPSQGNAGALTIDSLTLNP
jgi:glutamate-1-semialdehyde aminotransferase